MKKTIYIAGAMSIYGAEGNWGTAQFDKKEAELREKGWNVMNPANASWDGVTVDGIRNGVPLPGLEDYQTPMILRRDYEMIDKSDAIYFLSDWTKSPGAMGEYAHAKSIGIRCFFEDPIPGLLDGDYTWELNNKKEDSILIDNRGGMVSTRFDSTHIKQGEE